MTLSVNTNIPSLITQQHLDKSRSAMNQAIERMSSGLRINSAKDDASGLAMSDQMTSQIRGLNEAIKNSNDAISLVQTTEGALQETTTLLQRMRQLAIQSANDTNSIQDRASIQNEIISIKMEIDRIATSTSFNGTNVLDGSFGVRGFHVGDRASQIITVETGSTRIASLGAYICLIFDYFKLTSNIFVSYT